MRTTSSIQFYCRASKANKQGFAPVEAGLSLNGERRFLNLPIKFRPEDFNKKKQPKDIVEAVDLWRMKVNQIINLLLRENVALTVANIKNGLQTGGVESYTVEKLFREYRSILASRNKAGKVCDDYVKKFDIVERNLYKIIDKDKEVNNLSNYIILQYKNMLEAEYKQATAAGMLTKLKSVIQFGIDNGKIDKNPFSGVKIEKGAPVIEYLTDFELNKIREKDWENERLQKVADLSVLQVSTGLAYIDLINLTPEDVHEQNGVYFVQGRRHKTNTPYTAVMLKEGVEIWKKYNGKIPQLTNQKLNSYLKEIGDLCGIKKNLHTHLFRKTYATKLLNAGVREIVVAKSLGHTNANITLRYYAKVEDNTILNEVTRAVM